MLGLCLRFLYSPVIPSILCPRLDDPLNGMVMWNSLTSEGVATYTCDPGFRLVGDPTHICGSDGTWSGVPPVCEREFITTTIISLENIIIPHAVFKTVDFCHFILCYLT